MTSVNFCVNAENDSEWRVANGFGEEARFLSFRKISVMQEQDWRAVLLSSRICSFLEGSAPALPKNFGASEDAPSSFTNLWRIRLQPDLKISARQKPCHPNFH
ncbi:MAG: hypothetical protein OGMRLDGQ_003000 [Candidatus Fervidibacter sp.]